MLLPSSVRYVVIFLPSSNKLESGLESRCRGLRRAQEIDSHQEKEALAAEKIREPSASTILVSPGQLVRRSQQQRSEAPTPYQPHIVPP